MKLCALLLLSTTLALGCNKTSSKPERGSAAATTHDHVEVFARHLPAAGQADLDADPVVVHFDKFAVTKAHFDPSNLEGGTATVELDATSIKTGNVERDGDLESPAFIDVARFATVTIEVANVKKHGATEYTADATVACHGVTKTYSVTFEVVATTSDSVRIKGEYSFSRLDFSIGIDPAKDPTERVAPGLIIRWELTLQSKS